MEKQPWVRLVRCDWLVSNYKVFKKMYTKSAIIIETFIKLRQSLIVARLKRFQSEPKLIEIKVTESPFCMNIGKALK